MDLGKEIGTSYDIVQITFKADEDLTLNKQYLADATCNPNYKSFLYFDDINNWNIVMESDIKRIGKLTLKSLKNVTNQQSRIS